jgi:ABC-type lipoprotein release transport system permease subunit
MMTLIKLAWRNIWRNTRRTIILICAMASGLLGIYIGLGFTYGWIDSMIDGAVNKNVGHIAIFAKGYYENPTIDKHFVIDDKIKAEIKAMPGLKSWTPRLKVNGLISNSEHSGMINIVGTDPKAEAKVSIIPSTVGVGRWLKDDDTHGIVIGARLAEKFYPQYWEEPSISKHPDPYKRAIGKKLVMRGQKFNSDEVGAQLFRVVGIFKSGMSGYDESNAYITLQSAQSLVNLEGNVSEANIMLTSLDIVDQEAVQLRKTVDTKTLEVLTWKQQQPMTTQMLQMVDSMIYIFAFIFYTAMAFGIVNTLLMAVNERYREIGIMLAIGTKKWQIVAMVTIESFFLAVVSVIVGNILGISLIKYFEKNGLDLSFWSEGMEMWGIGKIIYPSVTFSAVVIMSITTFVIAVLFSLYPAIRAARFNPIEAIQKL